MPVENMDSNLDIMRLNPAHITEFPNGFVLDNRYIKTIYDTESPECTCFVSPDFNDDEDNFKFSTIQGAIDYIHNSDWYSLFTGVERAVVVVYPGIYTEQIHTLGNIDLTGIGTGFDSAHSAPSAILYNTGADEDHYPLRSDGDEKFAMVGLGIRTDQDGVIGKLPNGSFSNCAIKYGHFIERDSSCLSMFSGVQFYDNTYGGFKLEGTNLTGSRNILVKDCKLGWHKDPVITSTHTSWTNLQFDGTMLEGAMTLGGDWCWRLDNATIFRRTERNVIDTTGSININNSTILNGLHFISEPDAFTMIDSTFESIDANKIPDGECDITSDVIIPAVSYSGNIQHNGLSGKIQVTCPLKPVGCAALNRYFSIQDAIESIPVNGSGIVDLNESLIDLAELVIPVGADVSIEGHKTYSLTFIGDIVEIPANSRFAFMDMVGVTGENMEMNGVGAEISMESCQYVSGYVTLTNGAFAIIYKSSLFGSTGHKALVVNTATPTVVVGYSRVQGATGHEAVTFSVDADDKFKAKYSTFIHGDKDTSEPLTYTGATGKVDIAMYNCGLNAAWNPAKLYNTIGSANNTTDTAITF